MKLFTAFLKLIRWPNLVFIVLTQALFYYCIIMPVFAKQQLMVADDAKQLSPLLSPLLFWILVLASVLIAAAGYIINDYFDLHIDAINKPEKLVIDKSIKRRWAIVWHLSLSVAGIILSGWVTYKIHEIYSMLVFVVNVISVFALWLYSTTYKRKLLIGNVLISLLTAWTILILYLANLQDWLETILPPEKYVSGYEIASTRLFKFAILYGSFAFVISLIREVVKDMEDMEGDAKYHCKTMPIVWGVPAAKVFTAVWIIVLIAVLVIVQFYAVQLGWWWSAVYCTLLIIAPLIWVLRKLYTAKVSADYHQLSSAIKLIMLTGILSMIFIWAYV